MIEKRQIKKSMKNKDGKTLVIINISYPQYSGTDEGEKESKCRKRFNANYEKLASSFCSFAETKQLNDAGQYFANDGFKPFGCVMNCFVAYEDEAYISVTVDVTVRSGNRTDKKRFAQNWDKKNGVLCSYHDVFGKTDRKQVIKALCDDAERRMERKVDTYYSDYKKRIKKFFNRNEFCITPSGYGFIFPSGALNDKNAPVTLILQKELFSPEKDTGI
ncbi:MAG: hypothetical protein IJS94_03305 [Clostridia bacterium]|nr:hypothetical protein [Clostridia bacterium]